MKKVIIFFATVLLVSTVAYSQKGLLTEGQKLYLDQYGNPTPAENIPVTENTIIKWSEGFEDTIFPPTNWAVFNIDSGSQTWQRYTYSPIFGTASAAVRWESSSLPNDDWLVTPQFLVDNGDSLKFWAKRGGSYYDSCQIFYSTTGGTPPSGYNYITTVLPSTTPELYSVDLSALAGQNIYIAFRYNALNQLRIYLDSVYVVRPCPDPVGYPSNPNPPDSATDVSINLANLSWANGTGTTQVEVWFGTEGNLQQVYSGAPVTTYNLQGPLNYNTTYAWKVVNKNDSCGFADLTWTFTTEQDPNLWCFTDDFENGTGNWTITNDGGTCVWTIYTPPYPSAYTIPNASGGVFAADANECGNSVLSTATLTSPFDFSNYQTVMIEFDQDFDAYTSGDSVYVEVSTDNVNWTIVWQQGADLRNTHESIDVSAYGALQPTFYVRIISVQPGWDWWWAIDNFKVCAGGLIPVELSSFVATAINNTITLNWTTATETNNRGFEIERSNGGKYEVVGYVAGHGTTTEPQSYQFIDKNVGAGKYQYRLKQIDYDGTYEYSSVVEVEVVGPREFSLGQNYPNPFNPTTTIDFSLAVDSKVTLKIYDVLGQEVVTVVNGNLSAGSHKVQFNASNLNSGVYFYQIDARGIDGKNFTAVKKMILSK